MSEAMTIGTRCLLAVSPPREVARLSDADLAKLLGEQARRPWTNEFQGRLSGLAVSEALNRWLRMTRRRNDEPTTPTDDE